MEDEQVQSEKPSRSTNFVPQTLVMSKHKLRAHKKSRRGCRNCKLRSVKCDEQRPHCKRCLSYGVHCNFVNGVQDMQLAASGAIHIIEPVFHVIPFAECYDSRSCKEAALLTKFRNNVATTISLGKRRSLFQNEIVALCNTHRSLRYTIMSLTMMHERHNLVWNNQDAFLPRNIPSLSEDEIHHWYLATSCFNKDLSLALADTKDQTFGVDEQAALCATSMLLVALTFCYVEARSPEEAWPLIGGTCPSTAEDLQWTRMSNGKMSAQTLISGLAADPVFSPLVFIDKHDKDSFPSHDLQVLPIEHNNLQEFKQLLMCVPEVETFLQVADSNCFVTIVFGFWSFVGSMTPEFEYYLRHKRPTALLLLLYWFAKLNPLPIWWLKARTSLEGKAICTYLQRYHGDDPGIMSSLWWPTSVLFGPV